ncbi:17076_t:CDS:10 [Cetraspora pellucida]|uniref:17076_t:CDS:1 n=1 Tax=Cetraspora pellucida TaxID=1433469 RepID=A0A9N9C4F6_9GLOM|nr:17076_t:CDS:10 [Cetraspora pellucida]
MELQQNDLVKALKNLALYWVLVCFILVFLFNFGVYGQLNSTLLYSSSRHDFIDRLDVYDSFDVRSTNDGSLLIMFKNDDLYNFIHVLLPDASTIDIKLDNDINVTRIFPLTTEYYFLLYDLKINGDIQVTGRIIYNNNTIIKDKLFVASGPTDEKATLDFVMNTQLSSFLIYNKANNTLVHWITYDLPHLNDPRNGSFSLLNNISSLECVFSTVDGNYGFIIKEQENVIISNKRVTNLLINYKSLNPITPKISEGSVLYHARNDSEIANISCSSDYSEHGNVCVFTEQTEVGNYSQFTTYQINFLSSGSVIKFKLINISSVLKPYTLLFDIKPSFFGGYIVTNWASIPVDVYASRYDSYDDYIPYNPSREYQSMNGIIFMANGTEIISWNLSQLTKLDPQNQTFRSAVFNLMRNDTFILLFNEFNTILNILDDYKNPNIISTYPQINETILPGNVDSINITFSSNISRSWNSSKKLIIYYLNANTNELIFRKFYSISECNIIQKNLSCNVTSSIFNQWNTTYKITMDNNFVTFDSTNEPMYGISEYGIDKNQLTFKSITCDPLIGSFQEKFSDTTIGTILLRLENNVTIDLSFLNNLTEELVKSIPTTPNRIQHTNRFQKDVSSPSQYLIQVKILKATDPTDTLNLWDEIKFKLLGLLIGFIVLTPIILWARYKYPEGQNFMILSVIIILFDFIMDVLFIAINGRDVSQPNLYIPRYKSTISLFTICSGANVVLLEFLTSNFAGFSIFNASLSNSVKRWIYWVTIVNTFIEIIPQLIIQNESLYENYITDNLQLESEENDV